MLQVLSRDTHCLQISSCDGTPGSCNVQSLGLHGFLAFHILGTYGQMPLIRNCASLSNEGLSMAKLPGSYPAWPDIANVFFRSGVKGLIAEATTATVLEQVVLLSSEWATA